MSVKQTDIARLRAVESRLQLPAGWLTVMEGFSREEIALAHSLQQLSPRQKRTVRAVVRALSK